MKSGMPSTQILLKATYSQCLSFSSHLETKVSHLVKNLLNFNPLSSKSDQHQISPHNINT